MAVNWNAADKSANVTITGGLTVATTSATQGGVRADASFAAGKLYYEAKLNTFAGTTSGFGWANATASLAAFIGANVNGFGVFPANGTPSNIVFNNGGLGSLGLANQGGWFCVAFDIGGKLIWFKFPGGRWNNSATANPATGVGGLSVATIGAGPYFPAFGANSSGTGITANFGASPFQMPIPTGFTAVDPTALAYMAASKLLGYALEGPPQTAASVSKLLGYAILQAAPLWRFQQEWPVPKGYRRSISLRTHLDPLKLNLLGQDQFYGAPGQGPAFDWPNPGRGARRSPGGLVVPSDPLLLTPTPPASLALPVTFTIT